MPRPGEIRPAIFRLRWRDLVWEGVYAPVGTVVGFLAEYDALSGLSQKAGCPVQEAVQEGGAGHGRVTHSEWIECAGATGAAWVANASPTKTA